MYYIDTKGRFGNIIENILELMYPMGTYCLCCGKYIDISRTYCLCDNCIQHISWGHIEIDLERERIIDNRTSNLDSALACMVYGTYARRIVFDLKYDGKTYVSRTMAMIMADRIITDSRAKQILMGTDYMIPVPLNSKKQKRRGFNQTEIMAKRLIQKLYGSDTPCEISSNLHLKLLLNALVRTRNTAAQRSVSGNERYFNLENAFEVNRYYIPEIEGKSILLIDDILTTGSTCDRCAFKLKEAGAARVDCLALATGNKYLYGEM